MARNFDTCMALGAPTAPMLVVSDRYPLSVARWRLGAYKWSKEDLLAALGRGAQIAHATRGKLSNVAEGKSTFSILAKEDGERWQSSYMVENCFEILPEER